LPDQSGAQTAEQSNTFWSILKYRCILRAL